MNGNLTAKLSKATLKYIEMFHSSKNPIKIDYVVIIKILTSDKFPGGKGDKFFVRCKNNNDDDDGDHITPYKTTKDDWIFEKIGGAKVMNFE